MQSFFVKVDRPSWDEYFINLCFHIALRSEDANTRHGAIVCDSFHRIIGTGYNSLPEGISDGLLSNTRPQKYFDMIHAEENALLNTTVDTRLVPGVILYCTGKPCLRCLYRCRNKRIGTICYADTNYHFKDYENEIEGFDKFVQDTKMLVYSIKPKIQLSEQVNSKLKELML